MNLFKWLKKTKEPKKETLLEEIKRLQVLQTEENASRKNYMILQERGWIIKELKRNPLGVHRFLYEENKDFFLSQGFRVKLSAYFGDHVVWVERGERL